MKINRLEIVRLNDGPMQKRARSKPLDLGFENSDFGLNSQKSTNPQSAIPDPKSERAFLHFFLQLHSPHRCLRLTLVILSIFALSCTKSVSSPTVEYAEACVEANKDKHVTVPGFLNVTDKVPCMKMLNPKRDCGFKFMDKVNVTGKEIIVYLPEGTEKNQAETPDVGKSSSELKPSTVFTRDQVKFRLDDGTVIVPQADIATPVMVTGKVSLTDQSSDEKICSIMASKIEKRQ